MHKKLKNNDIELKTIQVELKTKDIKLKTNVVELKTKDIKLKTSVKTSEVELEAFVSNFNGHIVFFRLLDLIRRGRNATFKPGLSYYVNNIWVIF